MLNKVLDNQTVATCTANTDAANKKYVDDSRSFCFGFPNYASGQDITSAFNNNSKIWTETRDGWIYVTMSSSMSLRVNTSSTSKPYVANQSDAGLMNGVGFPVKKGDILYGTGSAHKMTFFPMG